MRTSPNVLRAAAAAVVLLAAILAYGSSRWAAPTPPATSHALDAGAAIATDAGHDAGPQRTLAPRPPRTDPRPDILLFTIDTLRQDHVSAYRYDRDTTPTIDALAARGARFDRAYSTSSWTLPALSSMLTSVIPSEHGVFHSHLTPNQTVTQEALSPALPSLAAALHDAGYRTVGITANGHLAAEMGFSRGFDDYENLGFVDSPTVQWAVERRLDALRGSTTPYFLWVHVIDPHVPYTPTEPQFSQWWPSTRQRFPVLDDVQFAEAMGGAMRREHYPPTEALEYLKAAYDSEIRVADTFLGTLLEELDDGHLAVVVTADHGEEFGDHHGMGHGHTLFEEVAHLPLVVAIPGQAPSTPTPLVSLLDVLPTLVDLAEREPPAAARGLSLLPAIRGEAFPLTRDIVMETGRGTTVHAIFDGHYKYGERTEPNPIEVLFDLDADPFEEHDILAEHPDVADALRQRLHDALAQAAARRPEVVEQSMELPQEIRDQLQALGYGH